MKICTLISLLVVLGGCASTSTKYPGLTRGITIANANLIENHEIKKPPRSFKGLSVSGFTTPEEKDLKFIKRKRMYYPKKAFEANLEGWCLATFDVSPAGTPTNIDVVECSPEGHFEHGTKIMIGSDVYQPPNELVTKLYQICTFKIGNR